MLKILTNVLIVSLLSILTEASEPYCVRNESIITRTPVMKTRQIIKKPTGFFKVFKKTKSYIESYPDFEEHVKISLVRGCCDGYKMSRFDICEPLCTNGCPKNAHCLEPNLCQCKNGYISAVSTKDGSHYCEPICNGGCPSNARCVEPDICECERGYHTIDYSCVPRCTSGCPFGGICIHPNECHCVGGYKAESGTCVPICMSGDGCQNGQCVDHEQCICNMGFKMNEQKNICEKVCYHGVCDMDYESESEFSTTTTTSGEEETSEIEFDLDEGEKIYLTPSDDIAFDSTTHSPNCPPNYIFYDDICHPQLFASNEIDCRFKPCVEHAFCQKNGTCACEEGYSWYKPEKSKEGTAPEEIKNICLTLIEINNFLEEARIAEIDSEHEIDWWGGCFILLGVLCMVGALCFLAVKMLRTKRNKNIDIEAKNDLYCTYDSRNSKDVPLVL